MRFTINWRLRNIQTRLRVASSNPFAGVRPQKAPAGAASNSAFQASLQSHRLRRWIFTKSQSAPILLLLLFRKRSRSARLLSCKRSRDGSLSLPTFGGLRTFKSLHKKRKISFSVYSRTAGYNASQWYLLAQVIFGFAEFWTRIEYRFCLRAKILRRQRHITSPTADHIFSVNSLQIKIIRILS